MPGNLTAEDEVRHGIAIANIAAGIGIEHVVYSPGASVGDVLTGVPFSWGVADSVYGVGDIEMALRRAGKGYVPGVGAKHAFNFCGMPYPVAGTAKDIAADLPPEVWRRLSAGTGTKGERLHGPGSNWPISMPETMTTPLPASGPEAC